MKNLCDVEVERAAINCLEDRLINTSHLMGNFLRNDKTPSIDGEISFVKEKKKNIKREDYLHKEKIPVQIKGRRWKRESFPGTYAYDLEVQDLNCFREMGGATLIVVLIKESNPYERKVYFNNISGLEAQKMLSSKNSSTIRIKVIPLPQDQLLDDLFLTFANDILKQRIIDNFKDEEEIDHLIKNEGYIKINQIYSFNDSNFLPQDVPLCQKKIISYLQPPTHSIKPFYYIPYFDDEIQLELNKGVISECYGPVTINEHKYFDEAIQTISKDKIILKIGHGLTLSKERNGSKSTINLIPRGTLAEQIVEMDFWINMVEKKGFNVEDQLIELPEDLVKSDHYLNQFKKDFYFRLKLMKAVLFLNMGDKFNDYPLEKFDGTPLSVFFLLVKGICNHTLFKLKTISIPFTVFQIGECRFIVALKKENKDEFRIDTFQNFNEKIILDDLSYSKYSFISPRMLNSLWNIQKNDLLNFLKKIPENEFEAGEMNELIIRLIQAYDIQANSSFLEIVEETLNWRYKNNDPFLSEKFFRLHLIHVSKRKGKELNEENKIYLLKLQNQPLKDKKLQFIANLLLDSSKKGQENLKLLKDLKKENFLIEIDPIMAFFNKKRYLEQISICYKNLENSLGLLT